MTLFGPGSSVGIATDYRLDGPGIESLWGEIFHSPRPALGPTQPPVQWVPCLFLGGGGVKYGWGVLLITHPLLVSQSWKSRAIPLLTLWATTGPVTGTLYLYYSDPIAMGSYVCSPFRARMCVCFTLRCQLHIKTTRRSIPGSNHMRNTVIHTSQTQRNWARFTRTSL